MLALGLAGFGAGGGDCRVDDLGVSLRGNFLLCNDDRVADRAMLALGLAGLGAGGFHCRVGDHGVSLRGNFLLCNDDLIADGAVFAFGLAGFGAGGFNCRVNDLGVSLRGNFLLCNDDRVADRAMFALGLAGCGAGGLNCRVDDLSVSRCGNFLLCNDDLVADGAVLALGLAGFGAGGLNCRVDDLGVSLRGYFLHAGESLAADRAFFAGFMTSLGAGSGLFRNFNRSMSSCVDCFGFGLVADRAGVGLDTGILTGRRGRDLALIPTVALGGNLFLRFDNRSADRAADAIRQTRFGAGRRLAHNGLLSVAGRRDLSLRNDDCVADGAVLALSLAGCGASSFNSIINDFGMTRSGDFLNSGDRCVANRAFDARRMTGFRAGGRLFSNINERMTGCIKHFGLGFAANSTSVSLDTGIAAGRGSRNYALVPAVTLRRNLFLCNKNLVADGAVFTLSLAGCGAGWLDCRVGDLGVSLGGNSRAGACFLAAIRTVGVAGVAWLGAGCFLGITKFCVLMCARRAAPYAFDIVDNIASLGSLRLGVGAVGVVQLSGGDGD